MVGISVPVPSVDDGAIVAALHIVWALRGRGCNPRERASVESWLFAGVSNVVLAGGSGMQRDRTRHVAAHPLDIFLILFGVLP